MSLSIINMTIFLIVFYHSTIASNISVLREKVIVKEKNLLQKFFEKASEELADYQLSHITLLGESVNDVLMLKPLIEKCPCFIANDAREITRSREFAAESWVFCFITSVDKNYMRNVYDGLWNCNRTKFCFVYEKNITKREMENTLMDTYRKTIGAVMFAHHYEGTLKFYVTAMTDDCGIQLRNVLDWSPGIPTSNLTDFYIRVQSFQGCPMILGTRHSPPQMLLEEGHDGRKRIIGGSEGKMLLVVGKKLNFELGLKHFEFSGEPNGSDERNVIGEFYDANITLVVNQIRASTQFKVFFELSDMYSQQCAVWCVPRIGRKWRFEIIFGEFSHGTWFLIGTTFVVLLTVTGLVQHQFLSKRLGLKKNKSQIFTLIMEIFSMSLGNAISWRPTSDRLRIFLAMCLGYFLVTTTAYKSSLASILSAEDRKPSITDAEGIIRANLSTGGDAASLYLLQDQIEDSKITEELIRRYTILDDSLAALRRVSNVKDIAYLISKADLRYREEMLSRNNEGPLSIDVIDECVLTYTTVIVMQKGSRLLESINKVLTQLGEAGLLQQWELEDFNGSTKFNTGSRNTNNGMSRQNFYQILVICIVPLSISILTFFGEIIFHWFCSRDSNAMMAINVQSAIASTTYQ